MAATIHYALADGCIAHLDTFVPTLPDPLLQSRYAGFASVSAVTVYELAIKEIFIEFAKRKNRVFGAHVESHFKRLNGRIGLRNLKEDHVKRFGDKYVIRFSTALETKEKEHLKTVRKSIKSSYANLITWRNEFAHEGRLPTHATYAEVCESYRLGKIAIECLEKAMVR